MTSKDIFLVKNVHLIKVHDRVCNHSKKKIELLALLPNPDSMNLTLALYSNISFDLESIHLLHFAFVYDNLMLIYFLGFHFPFHIEATYHHTIVCFFGINVVTCTIKY